MKKWLILLLALFCVACTANPTTSNTPTGEEVKLVKAVDGDTAQLNINGKVERVRFLLIDTPESVKENTPVQPYGKEASQRVAELLKQARQISVTYEKEIERDQYNRILAYVFVDGELIQDILVKEGLARVAYYKGHEQYLAQLQAQQQYAKQHKIGIWSIQDYVTNKGFKTP